MLALFYGIECWAINISELKKEVPILHTWIGGRIFSSAGSFKHAQVIIGFYPNRSECFNFIDE